jgi:gliding motility-associated-like protein
MINQAMRIFNIIIFLLLSVYCHATHNRAGEITYEQIGELTIRMTVTTYTKTSSAAADRDSLEIFWGDGTSEFVRRSNGNGNPLPNDVKVNYYIQEHTYPGRASYTVYFTDPNRVSNILNVNPPNSIDIPFFLSTTFTLLDPQFQGYNNSAILLQPPLDFACIGRDFIHNPNAFDADGDSLSYELVSPQQGPGEEVPNYIFPQNIGPGTDNIISLDPLTGTFLWRSPKIAGEYNIAFRINEYRQGVLINSLIRDMQVLVRGCDNEAPVIESADEFCVIAGTQLSIPIDISDPDLDQQLLVEATGGPFEVENPAIFDASGRYQDQPISVNLTWNTDCNHISDTYYQVVIRAVDNYFADSTGLATLKTLRIKVVGPPPENVSGNSTGNSLRIEWDNPYTCEDTRDDYFQGFSVWRKQQSTFIEPDTCNPGLEGYGYNKIVFITNKKDGDHYFIEDNNVQPGIIYCYRILAEFARSTIVGNPYNRVESLPSEEICLILKRDLPFLTEASVLTTSTDAGAVSVSWTRPLAEDLDTIVNPGPYRYQVQRSAQGIFSDIPGASISSPFLLGPLDTTYIDTDINTLDGPNNYRISFYTSASSTVPYGFSNPASTTFLNSVPSDRKAILTWDEVTPWNNYAYHILRRNNNTGSYEKVGSSTTMSYTDTGLNNSEEYCYIIMAEGRYGITGIAEPIFNNSQFSCVSPFDSVPPCVPNTTVSNLCEELKDDPENPIRGNTVAWAVDDDCKDDIVSFNIYYAETISDEFEWIGNSTSSSIFEFFHEKESSISGCYAVTSLDSLDNESVFSNIVCVENCPGYILPNTFTPNTDLSNDLFIPRVNRFIDEIDIKIFNQWGNKVFETNDPAINWDGTNLRGDDLAEGVYYYTCKVYEKTTDGNLRIVDVLKGHINLIR